MFGLGMLEILMILAIALIVVGPKKLPELAKTMGRAMGEFKRSAQDFKKSIDVESSLSDNDVPETKILNTDESDMTESQELQKDYQSAPANKPDSDAEKNEEADADFSSSPAVNNSEPDDGNTSDNKTDQNQTKSENQNS